MNGRIVWFFYLLCSSGAALQMTGPSTYEARVGSIAHIPCTFTVDKLPVDPKYFALVWYLDGKRILSYDDIVLATDPRYSLDKDRALNGIAHLTISNTFLSDGGIYTCSVTDSPLRREKDIKVEISVGALQMTGPFTYEARVGSAAHIPCTFTADKLPADPKDFAVFWYLEGKRILSYDKNVTSTDPRYSLDKDRALNGIADLTILNTFLSDGGLYTCSVGYSSFLMKREISMSLSARPLLSMLGKSVQRHRENTLICMANGYFPIHINVTWYKDGDVLKNQSMGKSLKYDNGTYQVNSTATITPSDDDQNKTFSCRIQHVSLQEPLQEDFQLTFEEFSSHVVIIIGIVIAPVVIIGIITAAFITCKRKAQRKEEDHLPKKTQDYNKNSKSVTEKGNNQEKSQINDESSEAALLSPAHGPTGKSDLVSERRQSCSEQFGAQHSPVHSNVFREPARHTSASGPEPVPAATQSNSHITSPPGTKDPRPSIDMHTRDSGRGQAAQQHKIGNQGGVNSAKSATKNSSSDSTRSPVYQKATSSEGCFTSPGATKQCTDKKTEPSNQENSKYKMSSVADCRHFFESKK